MSNKQGIRAISNAILNQTYGNWVKMLCNGCRKSKATVGEDVKIQAMCRRDMSNMYYTHIHTYNQGVKNKNAQKRRRDTEREREKEM